MRRQLLLLYRKSYFTPAILNQHLNRSTSDIFLVLESERDVVPFVETFKLFEAMHEGEIFAPVLILLEGGGVEYLPINNFNACTKQRT
jgi:hypothetical protein